MNDRLRRAHQRRRGLLSLGLIAIVVVVSISTPLPSQTSAAGALVGVAVDQLAPCCREWLSILPARIPMQP